MCRRWALWWRPSRLLIFFPRFRLSRWALSLRRSTISAIVRAPPRVSRDTLSPMVISRHISFWYTQIYHDATRSRHVEEFSLPPECPLSLRFPNEDADMLSNRGFIAQYFSNLNARAICCHERPYRAAIKKAEQSAPPAFGFIHRLPRPVQKEFPRQLDISVPALFHQPLPARHAFGIDGWCSFLPIIRTLDILGRSPRLISGILCFNSNTRDVSYFEYRAPLRRNFSATLNIYMQRRFDLRGTCIAKTLLCQHQLTEVHFIFIAY